MNPGSGTSWKDFLIVICAAALPASCSGISEMYSDTLRPLHVVTYITSDRHVVRKQAHFGDPHANVVTLTDDAKDGMLPYDDQDGLIDRASVEIYDRGLLMDVLVQKGVIFQDHLVAQRVKQLRKLDPRVIKILTQKFIKQGNYIKSASTKTGYDIHLKEILERESEVVLDVDGVEERLRRGEMKKIGGVYMALDKIKTFETDSGFAVVRVGNQGILLKPGQSTQIRLDPAAAAGYTNKFEKEEHVEFVFVVGDTAVSPETSVLEDLFHSFLVDRPGYDHVSFYRMMREQGDTAEVAREVQGSRHVGDQFADVKDPTLLSGIKSQVKGQFRDLLRFLYGKKAAFREDAEPEIF